MDIYFKHDQKCFNFRVSGIIKKDNKILLSKFRDYYTLPGGRVKFGETTEQAIQREIKEELNVNVTVNRLLSINENFFTYSEDDYHEVLFIYLCDVDESIDVEAFEMEDEGYIYVPIHELVNMNLKPEFLLEELRQLPRMISHNVNK